MNNDHHSPLVSIIIPVYNVAPYLREALDSAVRQTHSHLQILIIDDGSTDGSSAICEEYTSDPRVQVIHQPNRGLSCARNVGLDHAAGDYIAFLDPDDALHPAFLHTMLTAMTQESADLTVCRYTICKTTGNMSQTKPKYRPQAAKPKAKQRLYGREEALRALVDKQINIAVWNKLYKRELWDGIRFPAGRNFEDLDAVFQVFDRCKSVYVLADPLYLHRKRPGSITNTTTLENVQDRNTAFAHEESFMAAHIPEIFTEEQLRKVRQRHLNLLMIKYTQSKDRTISKELGDQIAARAKELGLQNLPLKTRTAYQMISSAPWLLKMTCSIYYPVKSLFRNLTGR